MANSLAQLCENSQTLSTDGQIGPAGPLSNAAVKVPSINGATRRVAHRVFAPPFPFDRPQLSAARRHHNRHMKHAILGIVLAALVHTVSAQALWGNVPMGASPEEVKTRMPEARDTSAEQRAQNKGVLLEIPRHELAGQDFMVSFLFESGGLQSVTLQTAPLPEAAAKSLTRELGDSLRKRYGLDVSTRSRRFTVREGIIDREWLYRRISVRLQHLEDHRVRLTYSSEAPTPTPSRGL
jgi:hypothetical protein